MARIPQITSRTSARSAGGIRSSASPADFGAGIGEALQGLGRATGQVADYLQQREEQDAARWADRTLAEFDTSQTQARINSMNDAPDGGVGTIDRWSKQFDSQAQALLEQAPTEQARQRMETALVRMRGGHVERLMVFEHEARLSATVRDLEATQSAYINQVTLDPSMYGSAKEHALAALEAAPIRADKKAALRTATEQNLLVARAQGLIDGAEGSREAEALLSQLKADSTYASTLDPKQFASVVRLAEQKVDREERKEIAAVAEWKKAQSAARTIEYTELLVRQAQGEDVGDEIAAFRERWGAAQDPAAAAQWGSLAQRHASLVKKTQGQIDAFEAVNEALLGVGSPMDPRTKEHRDAVELHYAQFAQGLQGLDSEEYLDRVVAYVANVGVMPQALRSSIRAANLATTSPDRVVAAADLLDRIEAANPAVLEANQMDGEAVSFLTQVGDYVRAGATPEDAVQSARELRRVNSATAKDRRSALAQYRKDSPSDAYLDDALGDTPPPEMVAAFDRLLEEEHVKSGDFAAAQKAALRRLNMTWGRTEFSGPRTFAPFAPEHFYGVPGYSPEQNAEWIKSQAKHYLEEVEGVSRETPQGEVFGYEGQDFQIVVAADRKRRDGRPVYRLTYQDRGGLIRVAEGYFAPDFTETEEYQQQVTRAQRALEQARRSRDRSGTGAVEESFRGRLPSALGEQYQGTR